MLLSGEYEYGLVLAGKHGERRELLHFFAWYQIFPLEQTSTIATVDPKYVENVCFRIDKQKRIRFERLDETVACAVYVGDKV